MTPSEPGAMPLILAVPSKGRLQENASAFFGRAGLRLAQGAGARDYRGKLVGVPGVEVRYLSASEIAAQLASGAAHLGVTGEDLIRETLFQRGVAFLHGQNLTPEQQIAFAGLLRVFIAALLAEFILLLLLYERFTWVLVIMSPIALYMYRPGNDK